MIILLNVNLTLRRKGTMPESKNKPISPQEAKALKSTQIPDEVIEVFNLLIAKRMAHEEVVIKQNEVLTLLEDRGLNRNDVFENHWLDIEELYAKYGWKVEYDKPGFNESYESTFNFKAKRNKQ